MVSFYYSMESKFHLFMPGKVLWIKTLYKKF
nr:MAG TPA: hypothetical protein [Caudoviricetes sp.]